MSEEEARQWPDLMAIVEDEGQAGAAETEPTSVPQRYWWQFGETRLRFTGDSRPGARAGHLAERASIMAFAFLPTDIVFSEQLVVFAFRPMHAFCASAVPSSRGLGSVLWLVTERRPALHALRLLRDVSLSRRLASRTQRSSVAGRDYYEFRAALMVRNNEGLTKTYNRFHDPDERDRRHPASCASCTPPWTAPSSTPTAGPTSSPPASSSSTTKTTRTTTPGKASQKKKPWRYRWPDDIRDEVLARLLELNAQRAEEEWLAAPRVPEPEQLTRQERRSRKRLRTHDATPG